MTDRREIERTVDLRVLGQWSSLQIEGYRDAEASGGAALWRLGDAVVKATAMMDEEETRKWFMMYAPYEDLVEEARALRLYYRSDDDVPSNWRDGGAMPARDQA